MLIVVMISVQEITQTNASKRTEPNDGDEWLTPRKFALFLALLVILSFLDVLLRGRSFVSRDFGLFSCPLAYFHRDCFWRGELPLWNPLSSCGVPFLAQWNTLTLYPPSLIYLILPLPWSLSFFCVAHLFWGGLGMYFLAHRWTGNEWAAGLGGVMFAFNGLTVSSLMWSSQEATWSWVPWVIFLTLDALQNGGRKLVWATLAGVLQMLASGPETIMMTWLVVLVLTCRESLTSNSEPRDMAAPRSMKVIWARLLTIVVLVALICAAQLLPFLEFVGRTDRGSGPEPGMWSMPLTGWVNLLVPLFRTYHVPQGPVFMSGQSWLGSYYAGIGTIWLTAIAVRRVREWRVRALAGLMLVGVLLAFGDAGLLYRGLRWAFPMVELARYPVKFVVLTMAVAPVLASFGFKFLNSKVIRFRAFEQGSAVVLVLVVAGILGFDWKSPRDEWSTSWQQEWHNGLTRVVVFILLVLLAGFFFRLRGRNRVLCGIALMLGLWLDFATHVPNQNPTVPGSVYSSGVARANLNWEQSPSLGQARAMVATPAMSVFQHYVHPNPSSEEAYLVSRLAMLPDCNLLDQVPLTEGFFALTPKEINAVTRLPYSHTNEDLSGLLNFMGVAKITAPGRMFDWTTRPTALPLVTIGQQPVFADDRATLEALARPNADLQREVFLPVEARGAISANEQSGARVLMSEFTNKKVSIHTETPAPSLVVVSQTYYPAWKASVDGQRTKLWRANYAFQALEVPAGRHQVQLCYEDRMFQVGLIITLLGIAALFGIWWKTRQD